MQVIIVALSSALGLYLFRKYQDWAWGKCYSNRSLQGKTYLVTGASSGIGKETVRHLLQRNANVIVGNRNATKTESVLEELRRFASSGTLIFYHLDLGSFSSIKKFVNEIYKNHTRIDVLINNAGVSVPLDKNMQTEHHFEINMGVNHLGHFLLTNLLIQKIKDSSPSRIVIVSSTLHENGSIDLDDLNCDKLRSNPTKKRIGYCNSKLANVYHGRELAERFINDNIDVRIVCPGWTYTDLFRYSNIKWWHYIVLAPIAFIFMRSASQGSQTIVYCATEKELPGNSGDIYRNCKLYKSQTIFDPSLQKALWNKSWELTATDKSPDC